MILRLCEFGDSFIGIAVFYDLVDAMIQMPLQNYLSDFLKRAFDGII
jgi:hypothetical protein